MPNDDAVSELVGTILLTAVAVVFASGFVILLFSTPAPADHAKPQLQAFTLPSAGDEVVLEHRGGPSVALRQLVVDVSVNGTSQRFVVGDSLTSGWSVRASDGTLKGPTDRFAPGDRAVYGSPALYGASARLTVTDAEQAVVLLSPSSVQAEQDTTNVTLAGARTVSRDTVLVAFSEPLARIAAADLRIDGAVPSSVRLVGNGSFAEVVSGAPFATDATPTVSSVWEPTSGTHDLAGRALVANLSVLATDGVAPDIVSGPALSGAPSTTLANLTWTTGEAGTSVVEFGPVTTYGRTVSDSALTTTHLVQLASLSPGTLYYYRVTSVDAAGNANVSAQGTFSTAQPSGGGGGGGDAYLGAPQTWTAMQTFGENAALDASTLTSGTIVVARLPPSLAYVDGAHSWTALQTFQAGLAVAGGQALLLAPTATGSLPADAAGKLVYDSTLGALRIGTGAGYGTVLTRGNVSGADVTSGTVAAARLPLAGIGIAGIVPASGLTDAMVSGTAAIAYSKLALANSIVASDLAAGSVTIAKTDFLKAISTLSFTVVDVDNDETVCSTAALPGASTADRVLVTIDSASATDGLVLHGARVSAASTVEVCVVGQSNNINDTFNAFVMLLD